MLTSPSSFQQYDFGEGSWNEILFTIERKRETREKKRMNEQKSKREGYWGKASYLNETKRKRD